MLFIQEGIFQLSNGFYVSLFTAVWKVTQVHQIAENASLKTIRLLEKVFCSKYYAKP